MTQPGRPTGFSVRAILFDLDGVLVDSRACVEQVWHDWGRLRGRDPAPFIAVAHGRRTSETIAAVDPALDARAEAAVLDRMEEECITGLRPGPGALGFVRSVPATRWGVVTSGHRAVATLRLTAVGIPVPPVLVTGEQVTRGKPDPEPYLAGLAAMGVEPGECLAFEDAPPGIAAAKAAGLPVIGLATTYRADQLDAADLVIAGFDDLELKVQGTRLQLEVR